MRRINLAFSFDVKPAGDSARVIVTPAIDRLHGLSSLPETVDPGSELASMWTLTGMTSSFGGSMGTPYTATLWMARSGRCAFEIASAPITVIPRDPNVYLDDTYAWYSSHTYDPQYPFTGWSPDLLARAKAVVWIDSGRSA